jgi:DNA-directed RNA polymerase specialized sigma24 family protein
VEAIGFIVPCRLTPADEKSIRLDASQHRPVITKWAYRIYNADCFRELRRDYLRGRFKKHVIPAEDLAVFSATERRAQRVLQSMVEQIKKFSGSFSSTATQLDLGDDDYFQEGCISALEGGWNYDGSTSPITSIFTIVRNHLTDLNRRKHAPVIHENSDEPILAMISRQKPDEITEPQAQALWEAFETAALTPFERAVFQAYLNDVPGFKNEVAKQFVNPKTGQPYCRMSGSLAFDRAAEKVRKVYEELTADAA